jgi:hypothetical protein
MDLIYSLEQGLINGVNDTCDNLSPVTINDIGDNISLVSLTSVNHRCHFYQRRCC